MSWPKIWLFGDSQTQYGYSHDGCWVAKLADYMQRKCDIVNRGFSGYNSNWLRVMLPQLFNQNDVENCAAVVIFLGSNDANLKELNEKQHVPLETYNKNLISMIDYLISSGVSREKITLVAPPPVYAERWSECLAQRDPLAKMALSNDVIERYAEACNQAALCSGVHCINLYHEMMKSQDWVKYVEVDGLHLALPGAELLFSLIVQYFESSKLTTGLKMIYPEWKDVNHNNPEESLALD